MFRMASATEVIYGSNVQAKRDRVAVALGEVAHVAVLGRYWRSRPLWWFSLLPGQVGVGSLQ